MEEILVHPWICQNQTTPLSRCVFPNRLKDEDLNNDVLMHMCKFMPECKSTMSQLMMSLLNQELSTDAAIYFLLEKRLQRYEDKLSKELIALNRRRKKSFSETDITAVFHDLGEMKRTTSLTKKTKPLKVSWLHFHMLSHKTFLVVLEFEKNTIRKNFTTHLPIR